MQQIVASLTVATNPNYQVLISNRPLAHTLHVLLVVRERKKQTTAPRKRVQVEYTLPGSPLVHALTCTPSGAALRSSCKQPLTLHSLCIFHSETLKRSSASGLLLRHSYRRAPCRRRQFLKRVEAPRLRV